MDYYALPGNIINADYFRRFRRNGAALKYLEKAMWGKKPQCPFCGCKSAGKWNRENWYRCNNYRCNRPFNARTKTIFQCTKIPLWKWFLACYYMLPTKGITGIRLAHELGVTRKTAWHMAHRIREAMKGSRERLLLEKLGGIIELDEIYPGGKEGNKPAYKKLHMGSGVGGKMSALGVVERGDHGNAITTGFPDKLALNKKGKLIPTANISAKFIRKSLRQCVKPGSTIANTDSSPLYGDLKRIGFMEHFKVDHSNGIYVKKVNHPLMEKAYTNGAESRWRIIKDEYRNHQWYSRWHSQSYYNESDFRWNQTRVFKRGKDGVLRFVDRMPTKNAFDILLKDCFGKTLTWNKLAARKKVYMKKLNKTMGYVYS